MEFNKYKKSDKAPLIVYADLEFLTEMIDECKNNPTNSCTTRVGEPIPWSLSMSAISLFNSMESKHDVCWGQYWMKKNLWVLIRTRKEEN